MTSRAPRRAAARLAVAAGIALLAAGCAGPLASPTPVPAANDSRTDMRSLDAFSTVSVDGPLNLVLEVGAASQVEVDAPSNILPLVLTEVAGPDLEISVAAPGFTSAKPVTVRISAPKVTSVSLTGGANGTLDVMAQALDVSVSGDSTLKGIGAVQQLTVTVLGNSVAELGDLTAETGSVSAAGGAKATLKVTKQLTGTADGGSVVTLTVAPVAQSVALTGGAKIVGP
jgi:hypothetical protein